MNGKKPEEKSEKREEPKREQNKEQKEEPREESQVPGSTVSPPAVSGLTVPELTELLQRVQADFENYRKQVEEDGRDAGDGG